MFPKLDPFFILGMVAYAVIFYFMYYRSRAEGSRIQDSVEKVKTLRLSIAALILSIILALFYPIWYQESSKVYDPERLLLLAIAIIALITLYILYKRE